MNTRTKIDYDEAKKRYVMQDQSLRQIARDLGLKSNASISKRARDEDWAGQRISYKAAVARRSYEASAASIAEQGKEAKDEALLAARLTIRTYIKALNDGEIKPNSRDAQMWAAWLLTEVTAPPDASTEGPDVKNVTPPNTDDLRRIVEAAREQVASAGDLGPAPLVIASPTRPN